MIKPQNGFLLVEKLQNPGKFQTVGNANKARVIATADELDKLIYKDGSIITFVASIEIGNEMYVKVEDVLSIEE